MLTGYETLAEIEQIIDTINRELTQLNDETDQLFEASQKNKKEQASILHKLAEIHFDAIEKGEVQGEGIVLFDTQIDTLLTHRAQAYRALQKQIEEIKTEIAKYELQRAEAHQELDRAAEAVISKEHEIQSLLEKDTDYQEQLEITRKAHSIAQESQTKAKEAQHRRKEKGRPYEESPFFMYLWKRHYGTSDYQASGLIRMLDGWIAKGSNYEKNRVNYWTLLEIPKRLEAHAKEAQESYTQELEKLSAMEHQKAKERGLPLLQNEESKQQSRVDTIDDTIEEQEAVLNTLLQDRQAFAEDRDRDAQQIIALINARLSQYSLPELDHLAASTLTLEDDRLVGTLQQLKETYTVMQERIRQTQQKVEKKMKQLHEVEALRSKFKRSRYDDIRSGFNNGPEITDMLGSILGGALNSDILWDTLRRSQRHVNTGSWPDFGSGGLVIEHSPWHFPSSRKGGSSFNFPDIGGGFSSRNPIDTGFSTGGGF